MMDPNKVFKICAGAGLLLIGISIFVRLVVLPSLQYVQNQRAAAEFRKQLERQQEEAEEQRQAQQAEQAKQEQERQVQFQANKPYFDECVNEANKAYSDAWASACKDVVDKWRLKYDACREYGSDVYCLSFWGREPSSKPDCELPSGGKIYMLDLPASDQSSVLNARYQEAKDECASQYPTK